MPSTAEHEREALCFKAESELHNAITRASTSDICQKLTTLELSQVMQRVFANELQNVLVRYELCSSVGTITVRMSSSEPALQNLPPRSDGSAKFKETEPKLLAFDHGDIRGPVPIDIETSGLGPGQLPEFSMGCSVRHHIHDELVCEMSPEDEKRLKAALNQYTELDNVLRSRTHADWRKDEARKPVEQYIIVAGRLKTPRDHKLDLEVESNCVYQTEVFYLELLETCEAFATRHSLPPIYITAINPALRELEVNVDLPEGLSVGDGTVLLEGLLERLCEAATPTTE